MKFKYENLEIWQLAMDLVKIIYRITNNFPADEKFGLTSQARRASTSIALNIAEGSGRKTKKDFSYFLNISITSLQEVDTIFKIAIKLKYLDINNSDLALANTLIEKIYFKTIAFRKKLT